jgi:hypothetical protein
MKTRLLSLTLLAALSGPVTTLSAQESAPAKIAVASVNAPDPSIEIKHLADLFQAGDLVGLAQGLTPRSKWEAARASFENERLKPTTDTQRAHFAEQIAQITAADAVDRLMRDIEPELAKARAQWPGMLLMASGAAQVAVNSPELKVPEAQREALRKALPGALSWLGATDFLSADSMRRTLTVFVDAARRTGITDIDQLKSLPLEGLIERASPMLAATKEAARGYGLDLDAIAASMKVDVIERGHDTARVRTTVTLFGAPVWAEHDLVLVEGHWYGKHVLAEFHGKFNLEG